MFPYKTADEASERISDSICLLKGNPVYVHGVIAKGGKVLVSYWELPSTIGIKDIPKLELRVDHPDWSVQDFNLGYFNTGLPNAPIARWCHRIPIRGGLYRAGLSRYNLGWIPNEGTLQQYMQTPGFVSMIKNEYPKKKTALEELNKLELDDDVVSMAFSRTLAYVKTPLGDTILAYKGTRIGSSRDDGQSFYLPPRYVYLREMLEENNIKVV